MTTPTSLTGPAPPGHNTEGTLPSGHAPARLAQPRQSAAVRVRFLSREPLLGPIDLRRAVVPMGGQRGHGLTASFAHWSDCCDTFDGIDWVIVGGESGRGARPMHPDWARSLRDQCQAATGVRFLFKQWGRWRLVDTTAQMPPPGIACPVFDRDGQFIDLTAHPEGWPGQQAARKRGWQMVHATGKHAAGRELDGRAWDEFPPSHAQVCSRSGCSALCGWIYSNMCPDVVDGWTDCVHGRWGECP